MPSAATRFSNNYTAVPESGCWLWEASVVGNGIEYGQFYADGRKISAHRYSYILHCGPIPDGLQVCHSCDVQSCVNPLHLFLGTPSANTRDMMRKGRQRGQFQPGDDSRRPIDPRRDTDGRYLGQT